LLVPNKPFTDARVVGERSVEREAKGEGINGIKGKAVLCGK